MTVQRVIALLTEKPMTSGQLQQALGVTQQRICQILKRIEDLREVGQIKPKWRGRPSPIYSVGAGGPMGELRIGRVSSVWELGA